MTAYEALVKNFEEINSKLLQQQNLLNSLKEESGRVVLHNCTVECSHKKNLNEILLDAISVLEESKRAFKSKQLEDLRKKMIKALADNI